ncbi:MAG: CheB methylesterase domain-containing protein [Sulfurimonas sp.]|nr:CheB methylesterase domain-containing protein [Sulfurimonas sp.]
MKHSVPSKLVLIGASTGGPGQIKKIINSLPLLVNTTIIIAQHMVSGFMPSFAKRLKENSQHKISMAQNDTIVEAGHIYLCEGFTTVVKHDSQFIFKYKPAKDNDYNPDINAVFNSCVAFTKDVEIYCVILTGIGSDGVNACKQLTLNGAKSITESEKSAIVDGMPCRVRKEVPNIQVSDIEEITEKIKEFCN